jgi:hypothetical protein
MLHLQVRVYGSIVIELCASIPFTSLGVPGGKNHEQNEGHGQHNERDYDDVGGLNTHGQLAMTSLRDGKMLRA